MRTFCDAEGAWNLHARGPAEAGARVMAALGPVIDEVFQTARGQGRREVHEAYAFDALVAIAERASAPAAGDTTKSMNPKFRGLLRVDVEDGRIV